MADEQTTTANPEGVARTTEGAIADQSPGAVNQTSTQTDQTTKPEASAKDADGKTLLTETKPEAKTETKPETKDTKPAVPDKYEDYKVPDGFTLDPKIKTEAGALFKGLGLSQDAAQSLVDFYIKQTAEAAQAPYKAYQELTDSWRKDAEADPDLRGKLGPGQEVNVRIGKALDSLGDPGLVKEFKSFMDLTGAGNGKAFIKVLNAFAQRVTEGSHVAGNGPGPGGQSAPGARTQPTAAGALWPNLKSSNP